MVNPYNFFITFSGIPQDTYIGQDQRGLETQNSKQ